jgi:serine/threonine-protein kinase
MTDLTPTGIERRALELVETLADHPGDAAFQAKLLEGEDPTVVARVLKIASMAARADAMPTDLPDSATWVALPPPERFGAFRFVSLIGRGGMGEVWLGQRNDGLYEQTVAIKLIQPHLQARAGEAFESERRMLARFEHPHIARLIDGGTADDGRACIVMEYVDGTAFDTACESLALAQRIALFKQVLDAVGYAHGRLVAHGDLKPSNIMVDREARVRLLDFGIARLVTDDAATLRLTGAVTSSFASPARLAGEPPTIADDIFALGRLLERIVADDGTPELAAIARKASDANEAARYGTVSALLADLDRWERQRPVTAMPRTTSYVARKFLRRNWRVIVVLAALAAALGYAAFNYIQTQRERLEASARFEDARGAAHYLLFPLYDQLAERPRTLLFRREVAATAQHYLDRLATSRSAVIGVRLEAAQGLLRLAQIEGSPYLPNLGQPELAKPNLESALAIVRGMDSVAAYKVAAQVELELANNADMVEEDDASALRHLDAAKTWIRRIKSPDPLMLAQYYTISSTVAQWKGDAARAVRTARKAQSVLAADTSLLALLRKSNAAELEGDGVYLTDKTGSIAQYRQSMAFAQQAVDAHPGNYAARRRLAITHYDVGTMLTLFGSPAEGLKLLQQASDEERVLMAFEPDDDNLRRSFSIVERARAIALAANGQVDEAMTIMEALVANTRRIWAAHPHEYRRMRDYAVFEMGLANLQLKYKRTAAACASYGRSQAIFERMGKEGHLSAVDRKTQLGGILKTQRENCAP